MKKIILLVVLFATTLVIAQEEEKDPQDINKKYELKINAFNLIAFSSIDVSYEQLLNGESSVGIALFYNFSEYGNDDVGFPKKFSITPYYRLFFSENSYARGFFIEGFGMINTYQDINYFFERSEIDTETSFALGISAGGKFATKSGFTTEVYLGIGRNLTNSNNDDNFFQNEIIGRFGISLGYRF